MKHQRDPKFFAALAALLVLALPLSGWAQFTYTNINGAIEITRYTGSGGDVTIPSTIDGYPVTTIGQNAFGSTAIMNVIIPDSVTSIGDNAFWTCAGLTSVTIGNGIISIPSGAFFADTGLTNVSIGTNVISIGDVAFFDCSGLTSVTIPDSVISIGETAFSRSGLINVTIPNSVTSIGQEAFSSCSGLMNVMIGSGVTNISYWAFAVCSNLRQALFLGNAPLVQGGAGSADSTVFDYSASGTAYCLPGTTGWGSTFGGWPTVLWDAQVQQTDAGFGVRTNQFGFNLTASTNIPVVVEACTNMGGVWTPLFTGTVTNGSIYFFDSQWTNYPQRFYRVRSQ
jgi:hypothetical protein